MSFRAFLKPRRPRLVHVVIVCVVLIFYFASFDTYTPHHARLALVPRPAPTVSSNSGSSSKTTTTNQIQKPPRILLVSAFFPLARSKHSIDDYRYWLSHFIGEKGVQSDIYLYTTPDLAPLFLSLHDSRSSSSSPSNKLIINTTYTTPMSIPPLKPYQEKYHQMHAWDRERHRHNPELYAVWNAKPWFLSQAVGNVHRGSVTHQERYDYAFWNDAGSFRSEHGYRAWPDPWRVKEVFDRGKTLARSRAAAAEGIKAEVQASEPESDLVFFPLCKLPGWLEYSWTPKRGPVDMDFSEGSFFGSTPAGISWFANTFYSLHDHYISNSPPLSSIHLLKTTTYPGFHFVGKDQTVINAVMFQYPQRFIGVVAPERAEFLPPSLVPARLTSGSSVSRLSSNTITSSSSEQSQLSPTTIDPGSYDDITIPTSSTSLIPYIFSLENIGKSILNSWNFKSWGRKPPCGGDWFYYQWWFASSSERRETERMRGWTGAVSGSRSGGGEEGGCEVSRVLSVEAVLRGLFGNAWVDRRKVRS